MSKLIRRFFSDRSGATAIEYGLIIAAMTLAIVVGVGSVGDAVRFLWSDNNSRVVQAIK